MALVSILRRAGLVIRSCREPGILTVALAIGCAAGMPVFASGQNPTQNPAQSTVQTAPNSAAHGASMATAKSPTAGTHSTHPSKHSAHGNAAKLKPEPLTAAPIQPISPPPPDWPANDKAVPPSVSWNGRDLTIAANNSSLQQILTEVSTATGVKVDGEESDQRIFGSYGPAPARDVLSQLLDGSGYNVLIIGDKGEGTPRELVLTAKGHAAAQGANPQARQSSEDDTPDEPEQPEQPNNGVQHRPFGFQPGQGRSPEQIQQDQQQRLQQQQQQQQQPQPPQPPPQPNPPNN